MTFGANIHLLHSAAYGGIFVLNCKSEVSMDTDW